MVTHVLPCLAAAAMLFHHGACAGAEGAAFSFFVAPNGDDAADGLSPARSWRTLKHAQQQVRIALAAATSDRYDITVNVQPAKYSLTEPLEFTELDGYDEHRVLWQAAPQPQGGSAVISGGVELPVAGWGMVAGHPGLIELNVTHLRTLVGETAFPLLRHLYVNGIRAPRTAEPGSGACNATPTSSCGFTRTIWGSHPWGCEPRRHGDCAATPMPSWCDTQAQCPASNSSGFHVHGVGASAALAWPRNGKGVEFVFTGVAAKWAEPRCTVDHVERIAPDEAYIVMTAPCWTDWVKKCHERHLPGPLPPTGIENVGWNQRAPTVPGSWYLDTERSMLQYAPKRGEDPRWLSMVVPIVEQLVVVNGARGLRFRGFTFSHTTWRRPGSPEGFIENQSGNDMQGRMTPASVSLFNSSDLSFSDCLFTRLGNAGLGVSRGSHGTTAEHCTFADISGAAYQAGCTSCLRVDKIDENNSLVNSTVRNVAVELRGAAAILVAYAAMTTIAHNEITNCSFVPVSMGWGWRGEASFARQNMVVGNRLSFYKLVLNDGGCIYTLDVQPGSLIAENWCSHQGTASEGGLYPDNHSANMTFDRNVLSNLSSATNWLNIDPGANNLRISNNWHSGTNLSKILGSHASILLEHNHFVQGAFPPSAMGIMRKSGPVKRKSDDDAQPPERVVDLGSRKHLFADYFLLSSVINLTIQLIPLVPAQTRLIVAEEPWEVGHGCYIEAGGNIIHERDRLRLWYSIRNCSDTVDKTHIHGKDCYAYAESTDSGRSWVKPHLNMVYFRGSKANNCVIMPGPWFDKSETNKQIAFKSGYYAVRAPENHTICSKMVQGGFCYVGSPDGLRNWTALSEYMWHNITSVVLPPDPDAGTPRGYTLYARDWWHDDRQGKAHGLPEGYHNKWGMPCVAEPCFTGWPCRSCYRAVRRLVGTSGGFPRTTNDWGCASEAEASYDCNWTMALHPDAIDAAAYPVQAFNQTTMSSPGKASQYPLDFYGVTLFSPGSAYRTIFMFGMRLWHYSSDCRASNFRVNDGTCGPATTDVTLSVSRDGGRTFEYVSREAVLSPGLAGSWSSKRVWVLPTPFQEGDTQTVVYGAYNVDENARIDGPTQISGIAASRGRLDGLSALATTGFGQVGEALTDPLRFTGSTLELNVNCGGHGYVLVEISDNAGVPISGYALADAIPVMVNSVRGLVVWKAQHSVASLAGQTVHLRFVMKDAKLFSFRFI